MNSSRTKAVSVIGLDASTQVKPYPISILSKVSCGPCWYIEYTRSTILDIRAAAIIDNPLISGVNFALITARYPIYEIFTQ